VFAAVCIAALLPRRRSGSDCLIVLGARIRPDGSMSKVLQQRCEKALQICTEDEVKAVFLCGGQCTMDPCPEAGVMKEFFLQAGVGEEKLIVEDASVNTIENLKNAKRIMQERGWRQAALVTSDYHLTRALWIARDVGLDVQGIAAPSPRSMKTFFKTRLKEAFSWCLYLKRRLRREI